MNDDMAMLHVVGSARVLVTMKDRRTVAQYDQVRSLLAERFPDLEFTFIEGATGFLVQQDVPEEVKA